jgi:regulator of protease activity HflC (stomatin/prohibitin superfamily)
MALSSNRARNLSIVLLAAGAFFFIVTLILGTWSGFSAISFIGLYLLATALVCFVLLIQYQLRTLAEQEKLDTTELTGEGKSGTIFAEQGKQAELFAVAQKRLALFEKWFIPILAAIIAAYQVGIGIILLNGLRSTVPEEIVTRQPLLCAVFLITIFLTAFLLSRYTTGMSTEAKFKPLRAAGSSMLGGAVLCFVAAICLALVQFKFPLPLKVFSYIIPALLILLGIETALNVVLDIYRPRLKDQYSRSAFDSRLLGIISEPGEVLHTVAGAIDYQFGFKVSQTWFYQLLERAIVPLLLLSVLVLYLLSTMVVVNPAEQAIVERFGNPLTDTNDVRLYGPGIVWKLPWPIDIAYKYPTEKVKEIYIGYEPKLNEKTGLPEPETQLIWGKKHYEEEYDLIVASPASNVGPSEGVVPVSLVKANIPVQYKIKNLYDFIYNHSEPEKLLEAICYGELAKYAASAQVEADTPQELQTSILGAGRETAKEVLTKRIQQRADEEGLGVEIVFVGMQGIHPPVEVAEDYQKVIASVQDQQAAVLDAQGSLNNTLGNLAGSVEYAEQLYKLAVRLEAQKEEPQVRRQLAEQLDKAFMNAGGDIFKTLADAKSYAYEKATLSEADSKRFADQLKPYLVAKDIYRENLRLEVFEDEQLAKIRKYIVISDPNDYHVYIMDMKEQLTPGLYDITGLEAPKEQ